MGKESIQPTRQIELTSPANSHKLGGGVIFMPNEGGEVNPAASHVNADAASSKPNVRRGAVVREGLRRTIFGKRAKEAAGGGHEGQPPTSLSGSGGERGHRPPDAPAGHDDLGEIPPSPVEDETPLDDAEAEEVEEIIRRRGKGEEPDVWQGEQQRYSEDFYVRQYEKLGPDEFEIQFNKVSPYSTDGVDPGLIRFICKASDAKLLYSFVNTIAALPLETEMADYDLGLYASTTMSQIEAELRVKSTNQTPEQKRRFAEVTAKVDGFKIMHTMNKFVATDSLEQLVGGAAVITPEHLQTMLNTRGAATVMNLLESGYLSLLTGNDSRATVENEQRMMGKELDPNELATAIANKKRARSIGSIEEQLVDLVRRAKGDPEHGIAPNPYLSELAGLQDWEIRFAVHAGRLLENISLRSSEFISQGKVPAGGDAWRSPPKERSMRLFNVVTWDWRRFNSGEAAGGIRWLNMVLKYYQKLRKEQGWGETHITKLMGGKTIEDFEVPAMFKTGSIFAGWRTRGTIIEQAPMVVDGEFQTMDSYIQRETDARSDQIMREFGGIDMNTAAVRAEIMDELERDGFKTGDEATTEEREEFDRQYDLRFKDKLQDKFKAEGHGRRGGYKRFLKEYERRITDSQPDFLRETFLDEHGELRPEFTNAYGSLLKISDITPATQDRLTPGLLEAKGAVRKAILSRMAKENPMALAFLLSGMEFQGGAPAFHDGKTLDDFTAFSRRLNADRDPIYRELLKKMIIANEIRTGSIKKNALETYHVGEEADRARAERRTDEERAIREGAKNMPPPLTFDSIIRGENRMLELSEAEDNLLRQIESYGKDLAGELAEVRFPFNPVMNDVVWGTVDFRKAGAIYYSRKIQDSVAIYHAYKEIEKIQKEPANTKPADGLQALHEAEKNLDGPNGRETSQEELLPFIAATGDFYQIGGQFGDGRGSGLLKWFAGDIFTKEIARVTGSSNSIAQQYGGVNAPAFDELAMNDWLNDVLAAGLTRRGNKSIQADNGLQKFADIDGWLRKKYNLFRFGMPVWVLAIIRNFIPVFVIGSVFTFGKKATEEQK